jgi:lipoyl(octanoyl) transferase
MVEFAPAVWRLLDTGLGDGAWNMAVDEAILTAVSTHESPPTLRFYGWEPACLSLGRAQSIHEADEAACQARGWHIVRRATGGRAILHVDELTYSVAAPSTEPRVAGGIQASYEQLSRALVAGLRLLGVETDRAPQAEPIGEGTAESKGPICFDTPAQYEITFGGRKLIGSAQMRRKGGILQHGTLPLSGDVTRIVAGLAWGDGVAQEQARLGLAGQATTLQAVSGRLLGRDTAVFFLRQGFMQALNLTLAKSDLTPAEKEHATHLRTSKYGHDEWNKRR